MTGPCTASRHGTRGAYVAGCRCPEARAANTLYAMARKKRTAAVKFGAAPPFQVDVALARDAIAQAMAAGWTLRRIEAETGIGRDHLARIHGNTARPVRKVLWATYQTLLDLTGRAAPVPGGQLVDGTGTRRRLHALVAIGWPKAHLSARLGLSGRALQITAAKVTARNAAKVAALYDAMWATPGPSDRARRYAAERGWLPPLWWDDDQIDDPAYDPRRDVLRDEVSPRREARTERVEQVHRLTQQGLSIRDIAVQLRLHPRQVGRDRAVLSASARTTTDLSEATG